MNIVDQDHAFILGTTDSNVGRLNKLMADGKRAGNGGIELQGIEDKRIREAGLKTFGEAFQKQAVAVSELGGGNHAYLVAQCAETKKPILAQAKEFTAGVHPGHWLAYNLSPSFNWDAAELKEDMEKDIWELGNLGFVWQFITMRFGPKRRVGSWSVDWTGEDVEKIMVE
ncbi:isocitrate lyase 1 [Marasmius tenuissimus]|uniref:methylisocitrate lyase n=1 Tax=Marasmius tenuissimus TaxID=585030 RepID=A0ABR2ZWQ8_9AGAR